MVKVKRLVLDVLKPHQPDILEFACAIARCGADLHVKLAVSEMDERTESTVISIAGEDINLVRVRAAIEDLGGSLHSIDEAEVVGSPDSE